MICSDGPQPSRIGIQHTINAEDLFRRLDLGTRQTVERKNRCRDVSEFFQCRTSLRLLLAQLAFEQTDFPATMYGATLMIDSTRLEPGDVSFQTGYNVHGYGGVPAGSEPSGTKS